MVDFESKVAALHSLDIRVVAASVDPTDVTAELAEGLHLKYVKLLAALDGPAVADATGAFLQQNGDSEFLHATGFVVNPDGEILVAAYSSGAVGRLTPIDVISQVALAQS